ncbi:zinc-ribbon domain-containing protein [Tetragenococcus halophilus]|uniref:zinc ribbon domain-containing protein n=1 Tax=Tetragenococcus halophilus TaxID=51669 RepID=UPI0030F0F4D3
MKYCNHCKKEYSDDHNFCEVCGKKLVEKTESQSKGNICPNCGKENQTTARFCESCGTSLQASSKAKEKQELSKVLTAYYKHKKLYNTLLAGLVVLLIVSVGLYKYGEHYYSKEQQIERYQKVLAKNDPEELAETVVSSDKNFKPKADNLSTFTNYTKDNKDYSNYISENLQNINDKRQDLYLKKDGKYFFLFDKYDLVIQPFYLDVNTNVENMQLKVNDKEEGTSDNEDYTWKLGPLVPGAYQLDGRFQSNGQEEEIEQNVEQVNRENLENDGSRELSFAAKKVKFDVDSDISSGELLFNGQSVGTIKDGKLEGAGFIWNEDGNLQIKQELGDLELLSTPLDFDGDEYLEKDYSQDQSIFQPESFHIVPDTNATSGDFYINDKRAEAFDKEDDIYSIDVVPTQKPYKVQLKQSFEDEEINSDTETVEPTDYVDSTAYVTLDVEEEIDEFDIESRLDELYFDVSDYTDEDLDFDETDTKSLAGYFSGGTDNEEFIDFKDNFIGPSRKSDKKDYVVCYLQEVEDVTRTGENSYDVQYVVNYDTYYDDDTDHNNQYFRYKKANLVVEDETIRIKDLGGADNFEEVAASDYE